MEREISKLQQIIVRKDRSLEEQDKKADSVLRERGLEVAALQDQIE